MRFNISAEINVHPRVFNHMSSLADFFFAFHLFGADVQQGNPRLFNAQSMTGQNVSHHCKLGQIYSAALGVGTQVKHNVFAVLMGHNADNRRTMDFLNGLENQLGNSHQRSGVSGRNDSLRFSFAHGVNSHVHTGVSIADNLGRLVFIVNNFQCVAYFTNLL